MGGGLSEVILSTTEEVNEEKNSECYAEPIQLLDDTICR